MNGGCHEQPCHGYEGRPGRSRRRQFQKNDWYCEKEISRTQASVVDTKEVDVFTEGQEVEVRSEEKRFEDSWFIANIAHPLKRRRNKYSVQYQTLVDETDRSIPLREFVHVRHIRPPQPKGVAQLFRINDVVDAFNVISWSKGIIAKVLDDSRYSVFLYASKKEEVFTQSEVRVHLEWIGGSWISTSQNQTEVLGVEGANKQTEIAVKRKRGRPKGSGKQHQTGNSNTQDIAMPLFRKGTKHEAFPIYLTNAQLDNAQLLSSMVEQDELLSLCPEKIFHTIDGIENEVINSTPESTEKVWAELSGPSPVELQTRFLCPHITGDNQLMLGDEITDRETIMSLNHTQPSYEVENPLNLEANANEIVLQSFTVIPADTCSSPLQPDEGAGKGSLPFTKCSIMWTKVEAWEAFQLIPQYPHFLPLEKENEELREGIALGHMLKFANLVEKISKASLEGSRRMFENMLKALDKLEEFGFTIQPLQLKLEKMVKIKDDIGQLHEKSKTIKVEVIHKEQIAEAINQSVARLKIELQAFLMQKEENGLKVTELQKMENETEERIRGARLDFDAVIAAPW